MKHKSNRLLIPALCFLSLVGICSLASPLLAPASPTKQHLENRFHPPGSRNIFGTDDFGRDILSRLIYGARPALLVSITSVGIAVCIGLVVGLTAGLLGGWPDNLLMLLMDALLSFPAILLAITLIAFLDERVLPILVQVMAAIGIIYSPVFARLVRAEVLALKEEGFIEASRALGTGEIRILFNHILPNLVGKLIVQASASFSLAIVVEASLSYLGLGNPPPNPSWGMMIKEARNYMGRAPWMAVFPGLAIALTVLSFNILGDSVSERLNPKTYR